MILLTSVTAAVLVHQLTAYGIVGDSGFALAAEVNDARAKLIAQDIDQVDTKLCADPANGPLLQYQQILEREYIDVAGEPYNHKPCSILLELQ